MNTAICQRCGVVFSKRYVTRFCGRACYYAARVPRRRQPDSERFHTRYVIDEQSGCWNWLGYIGKTGYALFSLAHQAMPAHRAAYLLLVGPIPAGLEIDHLCRNRACVNPEHLEAVTPAENNRRSESPTAQNARKTHCVRGHEFTPENTYYNPTGSSVPGGRRCKECGRENVRARRRRQRQETA